MHDSERAVCGGIADSLSRNQLQCFRTLAPHADLYPTPIPEEVYNSLPTWSHTNKQLR